MREINLIKDLFDKQKKCLDFEQAKKKKKEDNFYILSIIREFIALQGIFQKRYLKRQMKKC